MNEALYQKARILAARRYRVTVETDALSDGSTVYVARNPALPGCMSHGSSEAEAIVSLREAREDYIYSLLEDGLAVPEADA